ncbi:hypothetical protein X975_10967, partial [Stegodyphus mimosarum]
MPITIKRVKEESVHDLGAAARTAPTTPWATRRREMLLLLLLRMRLLDGLHGGHPAMVSHHAHHMVLVPVVRGLTRWVHHAHVARWTTVRRVVAVRGLRYGKRGVPLFAYGYQDDFLEG